MYSVKPTIVNNFVGFFFYILQKVIKISSFVEYQNK
jgi:hypothetical protein